MTNIYNYKKMIKLQTEMDKFKDLGVFAVGDEIYYATNFISKNVDFDVYKIIEIHISEDEDTVDFFIESESKQGLININQAFRHKNDAIKKYNENLKLVLDEIKDNYVLSEIDRINFLLKDSLIKSFIIDKALKIDIVKRIALSGDILKVMEDIYEDYKVN